MFRSLSYMHDNTSTKKVVQVTVIVWIPTTSQGMVHLRVWSSGYSKRDDIHQDLYGSILQQQLTRAVHRMKQVAEKHKTDKQFEVEDYVYLKLQPNKQSSVSLRKHFKLNLRFYTRLAQWPPNWNCQKVPLSTQFFIFHFSRRN